MPDWILLLPIVFPALGALALTPLLPRVKSAARQPLTIGLLFVEIALVLLNIAPGSHRWVVSAWERVNFTLALQMDGVTQLVALTMLVLLLARELVAPSRLDARALLVLAAALLFAAADGVPMLLLAWTLLDLALFGWQWARDVERVNALRRLAIGLLMALMFFAGALTARTESGAAMLALALWARLGLFPFHALLPLRDADEFDVWMARGIPLLAASNAWLHWNTFQITVPYTLIGVLAGANLMVTALWIWRASDIVRAFSIGAQHACALVPLTLAFGGEAGLALALWQTLGIAFALALGDIAQRWRAEEHHAYARWGGWLAVGALAGLPLTPAFLGRLGLYVALTESGEGLLLAIAFVTTLSVYAPVWYWTRALKGSETRAPARIELAGLSIALVAFAALAFAPMLFAPALGISESAERALDRVIRTNNAPGVLLGALVLMVPLVGAYFLRALAANRPGARSLVARFARIGDLEWFERAAIRIGARVSVVVRDAFTLTEENPTVWILFAALWIAIFIAMAR